MRFLVKNYPQEQHKSAGKQKNLPQIHVSIVSAVCLRTTDYLACELNHKRKENPTSPFPGCQIFKIFVLQQSLGI